MNLFQGLQELARTHTAAEGLEDVLQAQLQTYAGLEEIESIASTCSRSMNSNSEASHGPYIKGLANSNRSTPGDSAHTSPGHSCTGVLLMHNSTNTACLPNSGMSNPEGYTGTACLVSSFEGLLQRPTVEVALKLISKQACGILSVVSCMMQCSQQSTQQLQRQAWHHAAPPKQNYADLVLLKFVLLMYCPAECLV